MSLLTTIKNVFTKFNPQNLNNNSSLPFVHTFGYEKQYGKVYPHDFARMVEAYKSWAWACAWKNATSCAKVDINLFKVNPAKKGVENKDQIFEHPFLDLIKKPNPFTNTYELMTISQLNMDLTGNCYWWLPKNVLGIPSMIWQIPSHWMKIVPDPDTFISGYILKVPYIGKFIPFDVDEIIHFKNPSPFDLHYGVGPVWGAQYGIDLNEQIKTWGINFFMNNAQPSGVLQTEQPLGPEQYQRLKDQWNSKYRGSKNAGKMAILESGLKYQQIGAAPKDVQFPDVSKELRDEIMACFGVPASKLGLSEGVNRANSDTNDYTYQKETILPRLTLIERKLNSDLMPIYDNNLNAEFDNPVPEDNQFIVDERVKYIQCGFTTIDEEREKEGLDPFNLPETQNPLIPFNLTPAGQPKPQMDAMGNPVQPKTPDGANGKPNAQEPPKKAWSQKAQDAKWARFVQTTAPMEKSFAVLIKRFFQAQHIEVMQKLAQQRAMKVAVSTNIIFSQNEQNTKLKNLSQSQVRDAYIAGLGIGAAETNSSIDFNLFEPNVLRAVEQRIGFFADKVNATTIALLKQKLDAGIQQGLSIDQIAQEIDGVFNFSENFRSTRIAQTEIIGAANDGQIRAYLEAGISKKMWLTAGDEKVRDSHAEVEGQIVDATAMFTTGLGNQLHYPGDRSTGAPPEDIINCRCTTIPIL